MLSAKQERCIELLLTTDMTRKQIADSVGVNPATIYRWLGDEDFSTEYSTRLRKSLGEATAKAFRTMIELLDSGQDSIRYAAARDILDRAGYKPTDKLQVDGESKVIIIGGDKVAD